MADGITIRRTFEAILFKVESTEGVDAVPTGADDAIPFESGSFSYSDPYAELASNEASGSKVAGEPLVVGQPVQISFRFRLKGPNQLPTALIKPPHHAVYSVAGMRGVFSAAIPTAVLTAGTTTTGTLGTGFATTAQAYRGMPFSVTAGPNSGDLLLCSDYTAAKVATFADALSTALTTSSSLALAANWSYAGTSPADAAARLTDEPSGTCYRYIDGKLVKFLGVRGSLSFDKPSGVNPGFATFTGSGIFAGESDAAVPAMPNLATHAAPLILQGAHPSDAFLINRRPLPIGTFNFDLGASVESPEDPNSLAGYMAASLGSRTPRITCDPLQTLVATRNTLADIAAGAVYTGCVRGGYTVGNRWGLTFPRLRPVTRGDSDRGELKAEALALRVLNSATKDSNTRDGDAILTFY